MDKQTAERLTAQDVLGQLQCTDAGLSQSEVAERHTQYGRNVLTQERATALRVLVRQFQSPLIYFLAVAAVLAYSTKDLSDGIIITAILLINAVLGFSQEYRSERAVQQLSHLISNQVLVKRDGKSILVGVADLVPGDIATLKEGDVVPADIKLLTTTDLQADESQLTGESVPVAKAAGASTTGDPDASVLFTGSTIDTGEATGVVYAIANETALGKIAALSTSTRKTTQYEKSLRDFSTLLIKIIGVSLAITLILKILIVGTSHVAELAIFVIALAVAVVPEALPVIATLTLSRGALQLARQKVIVKRLSSLEDLGNVTILCTDKTGTLTENRPTIQHLVSSDDHLFQLLAYASIDRESQGAEGTQSSFDAAFDAYVPESVKSEAKTFRIVQEVPFAPGARRRRVILADSASANRYLVVIGSPETLLSLAHTDAAQQYRDQMAAEGREGMRHLALAYRQLGPTDTGDALTLEKDLAFLGVVSLADPLRASTPQTLSTAKQLGVGVKILTGDGPEVAAYVGGQLGLLPAGSTVPTGDELTAMSAADFTRAVTQGAVFARVSPEQKFAIIGELKRHGVVGYQGDGINDAPALKLADVAIAVDSATDVAKASADIILLDKDLGVIINAIEYGRAIFANINKYITYTMVGNFGSFFALSILFLFDASLPLLPRQVLLISLLTDVPLVAISTDTVSRDELARPSRYSTRALLSLSFVLGTFTALAELIFFATLRGQTLPASQTSLYLFFSFTQLIVIRSVRNRDHFWKAVKPSRALAAAMIATAGLVVAIPYIGPLARLLSFSPPSLAEVSAVLLGSLLSVLILDTIKVWYYKHADSSGTLHGPGWLSQRKQTAVAPPTA